MLWSVNGQSDPHCIEEAAYVKKLDEKWPLAEWRHGCGRIPLDMELAPKCIACNRPVLSGHGLA